MAQKERDLFVAHRQKSPCDSIIAYCRSDYHWSSVTQVPVPYLTLGRKQQSCPCLCWHGRLWIRAIGRLPALVRVSDANDVERLEDIQPRSCMIKPTRFEDLIWLPVFVVFQLHPTSIIACTYVICYSRSYPEITSYRFRVLQTDSQPTDQCLQWLPGVNAGTELERTVYWTGHSHLLWKTILSDPAKEPLVYDATSKFILTSVRSLTPVIW